MTVGYRVEDTVVLAEVVQYGRDPENFIDGQSVPFLRRFLPAVEKSRSGRKQNRVCDIPQPGNLLQRPQIPTGDDQDRNAGSTQALGGPSVSFGDPATDGQSPVKVARQKTRRKCCLRCRHRR